jgi:SAM-dependent methyltransferase
MDLQQRFARWYDIDQGVFEDDIPLYLGLAERTGSPILELGCGTGRLVLALAQAGHRVTGVEREPAMLARAREKVRAAGRAVARRVSLVPADFRLLELSERFRLAILAVNTWMDLPGPGEQAHVLEVAAQHLEPGGLLVLDLFHPHPDALAPAGGGLVLDDVLTDPETGAQAHKFLARQVDYARQVLTATFFYDELDADGRVTRTAVTFALHYRYRAEAEQMLQAAGFAVEDVYGSYELDPYTDESERLLLIARKEQDE